MSMRSYYRNRAAGVTGKWTGTCLPAALEKLSPRHALEPDTYRRYTQFFDVLESLKGQDKRKVNPLYKVLYRELMEELGSTYEDAVFYRLKCPDSFISSVGQLIKDEYRVTVDIITDDCVARVGCGVVHSVGLRAIEGATDTVSLASTWVPAELKGRLQLEDLFPHVAQINEPTRVRYPFNNCNVLAIPPG